MSLQTVSKGTLEDLLVPVDLHWVEGIIVVDERDAEWGIILYSLHFCFSWLTTWMWSVVEYLLLNPALAAGFRRVSSLVFLLVLS